MSTWAKRLNTNTQRCFDCSDMIPVNFRFVAGDHGDRFPFEKRTHKVAHVVSTKSDKLLPEVHFNAEAFLVENEDPEIYFVALHEIGHVLGLSHSADPTSIMFPVYQSSGVILDSEVRSPILATRLAFLANATSRPLSASLSCNGGRTIAYVHH